MLLLQYEEPERAIKKSVRCWSVPGVETQRKASRGLSLWCMRWKRCSSIILRSNKPLRVTEHRFGWHQNLLHRLRSAVTRGGLFTLTAQIQDRSAKGQPQPRKPCKGKKPSLSVLPFFICPYYLQVPSLPTKCKWPEPGTLSPSSLPSFQVGLVWVMGSHWCWLCPTFPAPSRGAVPGGWLLPLQVAGTWVCRGFGTSQQACSSKDVPKTLTWCMLDLILK